MPAKRRLLLVMLSLLNAGAWAQPLARMLVNCASASERSVAEGGEARQTAIVAGGWTGMSLPFEQWAEGSVARC